MGLLKLFHKNSIPFLLFSAAVLFWPSITFAQKNSFTNYSIEDGLLQSQVTRILEDHSHHLIIATYLGINVFDGKTFAPLTKETDSTDNVLDSMEVDHRGSMVISHKGEIWSCGSTGLHYFFAGKIKRFLNSNSDSAFIVNDLAVDKQDNIWGIKNWQLVKITGNSWININITGAKDSVVAITANRSGNILAVVANKGIFCFKNNSWVNIAPRVPFKNDMYVKELVADGNDDEHVYFITENRILSIKNHIISPLKIDFQKDGADYVSCITQDDKNGLWIGTSKGAYYINNGSQEYFNETNGFTNVQVNEIFKDVDNNIWFGTNGEGIFRFNGDSFVIFDQAQGIGVPVLQFAKEKNGDVLVATGSKLMAYDGKNMSQLKTPAYGYIRWLYTDNEQNTWISAENGLWKKNGQVVTRFFPTKASDSSIALISVLQDRSNTLWTTATTGCYYWNNGFVKIKGLNSYSSGLLEIGRDSMLVGTRNGAVLVSNKKIDYNFKAPFLKGRDVMCMKFYKGRIFAGTFDRGLFIWNPHGGPITKLNSKNGLSSNSVYSVGIDKNDVLWMGTGRAVNQFKINADGTLKKIINEDIINVVVECNESALLFDNDKVWIGTTKGVYVFKNQTVSSNASAAPYTSIQDVRFYNKQNVAYTYKDGYKEPVNLKLPYDNSHITLSFNGIYLKDPGNVSYSYKLWPVDKRYSPQVKNNVVDFPSLPPGIYVFYVKAYTAAGAVSNIASFNFEITPAYYQTASFKVGAILLLFLIGVLAWKYTRVIEDRKRRLIAHLRLEEQVKIRKQTAEDFHDDLGNKLTRINVLSDILFRKIDPNLPDERKLIVQIKENADALFTGSKHILWALDPDNDRLSEVLVHIKEFGIDLFLNSSISFSSDLTDDIFKEITLPMGYGRNITMICKELFNNVLRHSSAKNIKASAFLKQDNAIYITVEDDGTGFDAHTVKSGHGMRNINNRAKKMNGVIETSSLPGEGTTVTVVIKTVPHLR